MPSGEDDAEVAGVPGEEHLLLFIGHGRKENSSRLSTGQAYAHLALGAHVHAAVAMIHMAVIHPWLLFC